MTDRPRPAPAHFPYNHRTLAEVEADRRAAPNSSEPGPNPVRFVVPPSVRIR